MWLASTELTANRLLLARERSKALPNLDSHAKLCEWLGVEQDALPSDIYRRTKGVNPFKLNADYTVRSELWCDSVMQIHYSPQGAVLRVEWQADWSAIEAQSADENNSFNRLIIITIVAGLIGCWLMVTQVGRSEIQLKIPHFQFGIRSLLYATVITGVLVATFWKQRGDPIKRALKTKVSLKFEEEPLSDVIAVLEAQLKIQIEMDSRAFGDVRWEPTYTCDIKNKRFDEALKLILNQQELDFVVTDGVVLVSTKELCKSIRQLASPQK